MTIRKIVGYILISVAVIFLGFTTISDALKVGTCWQITKSDIANPSQSVQQYAQHSIAFNELCDPTTSFVIFTLGFVVFGVGVYLVKRKEYRLKDQKLNR